ncbi:MAG: RNA polymerase sigma factor [Balneolaceae bacterium]
MENQPHVLEKIIKGCLKHRRDSQQELYRMFYGYGMSITLRYTDSRDQAAGVLNDAFMKVFSNIKKYDSERPFKPWLRRIIVNTAINHYHKNEKNRQLESLETAQGQLAKPETIISGLSYREIIEMVQQLSPAYRTVFNLYVIEGFNHGEIARILGISEGTSKSNLARAKQNLRAMLEKNLI